MKYQNIRNQRVMQVIKEDNDRKTYLIKFEDGTSSTISYGTFKRWYKPIEAPEEVGPVIDLDNPITDEEAEAKGMVSGDAALEQAVVDPEDAYVAEIMEQKRQLGIECPEIKSIEIVSDDTCVDGRTYAEIGKEIAEQAKAKAKASKAGKTREVKAKKTKAVKEVNTEIPKIMEYIEKKVTALGAEIFAPEKAPKVKAFKIGGHMFARMNFSSNRVCLCCRSKAVTEQADASQKHIFDSIFIFTDLSRKTLIDSLIKESFKYQTTKNNSKEEK